MLLFLKLLVFRLYLFLKFYLIELIECYEKIISFYKINEFSFFKEYEELRKEYEELRRPFNNTKKIQDVLKYSQESSNTKKYNHPTQKA